MQTASPLAHMAIQVRDVERSLDFYVNTLGLTEVMRLERDGRLWLVYLRTADDQFLELCSHGEGGPAIRREASGSSPVCLPVPDMDQCVRDIEAAGIPFYRPIAKQADSNWQCWVRDPDDHRIALMEMAHDIPQGAAIARLHNT
jgi:lactoylglutathione lyase